MSIITALTPDFGVVQMAVSRAVDGDTVKIAAGAATWSSTLALSKGIILSGAGIGQTKITHNTVGIDVTVPKPKTYTIDGIEWLGDMGGGFNWMGAPFCIQTSGDCRKLRITNCRFHNDGAEGGFAIRIGWLDDFSHQYGVIDNCTFDSCKILVLAGNGDESWKQASNLGGGDALYIEDNEFRNTNGYFNNAVDGNEGERIVFRHNKLYDVFIMGHSLQNADPAYICRGTRLMETYENDLYATLPAPAVGGGAINWCAIYQGGGTGVHFNNRVHSGAGQMWTCLVGFDIVRVNEAGGGNLGKVTGSNPIDGNELSNGYPALDQPGRGLDNGTVASQRPPYSPRSLYHPQALEPIYVWNNTIDGVVRNAEILNGCGPWIKESRDFYNSAKPGYVPYTYPHPLRSGDNMSQTHTAQVLITITAAPVVPDFTIGMTPPTSNVQKGANIVLQIAIAAVAGTGFTGPVTLTVGALPTGCTGTLSKATANPGETVTLTINTSNNAAPVSNFAVIVTAVG